MGITKQATVVHVRVHSAALREELCWTSCWRENSWHAKVPTLAQVTQPWHKIAGDWNVYL